MTTFSELMEFKGEEGNMYKLCSVKKKLPCHQTVYSFKMYFHVVIKMISTM